MTFDREKAIELCADREYVHLMESEKYELAWEEFKAATPEERDKRGLHIGLNSRRMALAHARAVTIMSGVDSRDQSDDEAVMI